MGSPTTTGTTPSEWLRRPRGHAAEVLSLDERGVADARLDRVENALGHASAERLARALNQLASAQHERAAAATPLAAAPGRSLRGSCNVARRLCAPPPSGRTTRRNEMRAHSAFSCSLRAASDGSFALARSAARASLRPRSRSAIGARRSSDSSSRYARSTCGLATMQSARALEGERIQLVGGRMSWT